jgi:NTP pyrophosphatase (non-canonical NTP hydrolase)
MTFTEYQKLAAKSDRTGVDDLKSLMITLLGLAGEAGSLLSEYKKWLRDGEAYKPFTDQVSEEIGDILWYLANLASKLKLDLGEVASENLAKIEERWPVPKLLARLCFQMSLGDTTALFHPLSNCPSQCASILSRKPVLRGNVSF